LYLFKAIRDAPGGGIWKWRRAITISSNCLRKAQRSSRSPTASKVGSITPFFRSYLRRRDRSSRVLTIFCLVRPSLFFLHSCKRRSLGATHRRNSVLFQTTDGIREDPDPCEWHRYSGKNDLAKTASGPGKPQLRLQRMTGSRRRLESSLKFRVKGRRSLVGAVARNAKRSKPSTPSIAGGPRE
jgi:hypothetical protein